MNKPLVLVVEDDTPVRNLITTTLKTHEYRYLSAQNGASAGMGMMVFSYRSLPLAGKVPRRAAV